MQGRAEGGGKVEERKRGNRRKAEGRAAKMRGGGEAIEVSGSLARDSCLRGGSGMVVIYVIEVDDCMKWLTG